MRKESAETQDYVSCQDTEVDNDKSKEEAGSARSAASDSAGRHDQLRVKHMCDKMCNEEGSNFEKYCSHRVEHDVKPHTINLCRNCFDGER